MCIRCIMSHSQHTMTVNQVYRTMVSTCSSKNCRNFFSYLLSVKLKRASKMSESHTQSGFETICNVGEKGHLLPQIQIQRGLDPFVPGVSLSFSNLPRRNWEFFVNSRKSVRPCNPKICKFKIL